MNRIVLSTGEAEIQKDSRQTIDWYDIISEIKEYSEYPVNMGSWQVMLW